MKTLPQSFSLYWHIPYWELNDDDGIPQQEFIEGVGRTCYKSEDKINEGTATKFVKMLYERGHHAMLEHVFASVVFVTDRGVSHEMVRHRLVSFAQESTRYCNYSKDKFGKEITIINPPEETVDSEVLERRKKLFELVEQHYMWEIEEKKIQPQIARGVLPTCLKTEIWMSANIREWLHILELRTSSAAHPQMREIMTPVLERFAQKIPEMFGYLWDRRVKEKSK